MAPRRPRPRPLPPGAPVSHAPTPPPSPVPSLPTLRDVADLAGVSPTTASMALSGRTGSARLSQASIEKVQAAAARLGYRGNYHARTLSSGRSMTLGLAAGAGPVSILEHDFFNHICGGVEAASRARGYDVLVIGGTATFEPLERARHHLEARRIDALIVLRHLYPSLPEPLLRTHLPVVVLEASPGDLVPAVRFDPEPGIRAAVAHLAALGHRQLVWLAGGAEAGPRGAAFQRAVRDAGVSGHLALLPPTPAPAVGGARTGDYQAQLAAQRELPWPRPATAILCHHDELALALLAVLAARGIAVPDQLSVIGFDDRFARYAVPALTSISHALPELGRACVDLALDLLDERVAKQPIPERTVSARLVVRASSGPARSAG